MCTAAPVERGLAPPRQVLQTAHGAPVTALAASQSGLVASRDGDGALAIWDPATLAQLAYCHVEVAGEFDGGGDERGELTWTEDGRHVVVLTNGAAKIFDLRCREVAWFPAGETLYNLGGEGLGRWVTREPGIIGDAPWLEFDLRGEQCAGVRHRRLPEGTADVVRDGNDDQGDFAFDDGVTVHLMRGDTQLWVAPLPRRLGRRIVREDHGVADSGLPIAPTQLDAKGVATDGDASLWGGVSGTQGGSGLWGPMDAAGRPCEGLGCANVRAQEARSSERGAGLDPSGAVGLDAAAAAAADAGPSLAILTPDTRFVVASTSDGGLFVYDRASGRFHGELGRARVRVPTHWRALPGGAVLRDADRLASWRWDDVVVDLEPTVDHRAGRTLAAIVGAPGNPVLAYRHTSTPDGKGICPSGHVRWTFVSGAATRAGSDPAGATAPGSGRDVCIAADRVLVDHDLSSGRTLIALHDRQVAVMQRDGTITDLELRDWAQVAQTFEPTRPAGVAGLSLTAGGEHVLGGANHEAIVWSASSGRVEREVPAPTIERLQPAAGEPSACQSIGGDKPIGGILGFFALPAPITAVTSSPNGKAVLVLSAPNHAVTVLDAETGESMAFEVGGDVSVAAIGDDGSVAVGTSSGELRVFREGREVGRNVGAGGAILSMEITTDRVMTVSDDGGLGVWRLADATQSVRFALFDDDESVTFTPAGAYTGTAEVADRVRWIFDTPTEAFAFEQFADTFADAALVRARLRGEARDVEVAVRRPPRLAVQRASALEGVGARLSIHATSEVGIAQLRVFAEGRLVEATSGCERETTRQLDVPLRPGVNRVAVYAFDAEGRASNPVNLSLDGPTSTERRPRVHVVAVGIDAYPNLPPRYQLRAAEADARAIVDAFAARAGASGAFSGVETTLLLGAKATPKTVRAALATLERLGPNDLAVVHFSGHGIKPAKDADMVFLTGQATMTAADAAKHGVGWSEIGEALSRVKGRTLVLLDACHAGHLTRELVVPNAELASRLGDERGGVIVFAASKGRQQSYENVRARGLELDMGNAALVGAKSRSGNGYFTGAVLAALADPRTDRDGDRVLSVSELIDDVTRRVTVATGGLQTPWIARRELLGDFAVAPAEQ